MAGCPPRMWGQGADPHQDVQAGSLEEGDLVGDGEGGEAGQLLGELHRLNDALGGEFTELVPEVNVQRDALLGAVVLGGPGRGRVRACPPPAFPSWGLPAGGGGAEGQACWKKGCPPPGPCPRAVP